MNDFKKYIFTFLIFFFFFISLSAQKKDFEIRTGAIVKSKFLKIFDLSVEEQFRFNNNATRLSKYFTDLGLSYDITKNIEFSGFYRYVRFRQFDGTYNYRHRFYTDLSLKKDIRRLSISFRTRYQARYVDIVNHDSGFLQKNYSRNKISLKYDHRKYPVALKASNEWYYRINRIDGNKFDKYKIELGCDYIINLHNEFRLSYVFEQEINVAEPQQIYILELGYSYNF